MVVVGGLVGLAGIVDDVVDERDAALRGAVVELEVVPDLHLLGRGRALRLLTGGKSIGPDVDRRDIDHLRFGGGGAARQRVPRAHGEERAEQHEQDDNNTR